MVTILRIPLPQPQAKQLRDWLSSDGVAEFQRLISSHAAAKAAEAGNCMEEGGEQAEIKAKLLAEEARHFSGLNKIIEEMRAEGYSFVRCELKPEIVKTTQ